MQAQGYRVTLEHQAVHWWYRSRRELWLRQVDRAARALGYPARRLELLDYGCATGFDLPSLARFGAAHGADIVDAGQIAAVIGGDETAQEGAFPIHRLPADLPALRGRFHVITCLDVLEHMDDDVEGLRAIARPAGARRPARRDGAGLRLAVERRGRHQRAPAALHARDAASRRAGGRLRRAVRQLLLRERAAGRGRRRLGPAADVERAGATQTNLDAHPRWLGGVLRAVTSRGGAPRRRRAPVAARGREPRLPPAAAGAIVSDGRSLAALARSAPGLRGADHRRRRARRGDRLPRLRLARHRPARRRARTRASAAYLGRADGRRGQLVLGGAAPRADGPGSAAGVGGHHQQHDVLRDRQRHRARRLRAGVRRLRSRAR